MAAKAAGRRAGRMWTPGLRRCEARLLRRDRKGKLDAIGRAKLAAYQRELKWRGEGDAGQMVLT